MPFKVTNFGQALVLNLPLIWIVSPLAHSEAYEKAGILHRDISVGNIMLYKGGGFLIDWDLSKFTKLIGTEARQAERSVCSL